MQRRLRWRPPAPIDLNEARLRVMFDALEQAREWLRQEALDPPVAEVWSERPGEDLSAQYAFALGQVDRMVTNALDGAMFGTGDMLDRVKRLRGLIDATLERCAREGHPASPPAERAGVVRAWAFRRARRELQSLLHMTPGSGVVRRPSGLSRWSPGRGSASLKRHVMAQDVLPRLLLLDDDARLRDTFEHAAHACRVELLAVATADEVRRWIDADGAFDLIVCDWNIGPDGTSGALIRELVEKGHPVVVVTADATRVDVEAGVRVLEKPVTLDELLRFVS